MLHLTGSGFRYTSSQLVEVNAHSLFSKWFSESGKLVSKLFQAITEMVEEPDSLVFVLIDEVESLTAARKVRREGGHDRGCSCGCNICNRFSPKALLLGA